jgi:hypothetical protein
MRPGIPALAAVLVAVVGQPAWSETKQKNPKPRQVAQRQIICTMALHGCKEVWPGCRVESMPSRDRDASGHQKEVCPDTPR